jgi:hypothetical protein
MVRSGRVTLSSTVRENGVGVVVEMEMNIEIETDLGVEMIENTMRNLKIRRPILKHQFLPFDVH